MEWVARFVGAFYLVGGLFALRAARMNHLIDKALSAIDLKPTPPEERVRGIALTLGAVLTALSGLALLLLFRWSAWIFLANLLLQLGYLLWASRWLKPEDDEDRKGRDRTRNAAILWGLATLAVIWWTQQGLLTFPTSFALP